MIQYIDKATVVEEIKGYISNYKEIVAKTNRNDSTWIDSVSMIDAKIDVLQHLLFFLNTLEVKDVDEIIKNAEDHAYFAGSENTREKLINKTCKWWEVELIFPSMTPDEIKWYKNKVRRFRKDMEDET